MTTAKQPIQLSNKWLDYLRSMPETGMGYQIVTVVLRDERVFNQVIVDSGCLTKVRGYLEVPFSESEISEMRVTHDKWNWKEDESA